VFPQIETSTTSAINPWGAGAEDLADLKTLSKDLIDRFVDLRYLSSIHTDQGCQWGDGIAQRIWYSDKLFLTERSLMSLSNVSGHRNFVTYVYSRSYSFYLVKFKLRSVLHLNIPSQIGNWNIDFSRSCCIAAIIFIDNYLRGINLNARIIGRLVARLKMSLQLSLNDIPSLAAATTITGRAMLWVLCVGGHAADHRQEESWFLANLVDLCDILELYQYEDVESILKNFLWPSNWDGASRLLWDSAQETRLKRGMLLPTICNLGIPEQFAME
jgi:hypothetical protein